MKKYGTVFSGASYTSIGYALTHHDCLIIEQREMPGADFHSCFRLGDDRLPVSEAGKKFSGFLTENGIVKDGKVDYFSLPIALCRYIELEKLTENFRFDAFFVEKKRTDDGILVTYYSNEGFNTVLCDRFFDTTLSAVSVKDKTLTRHCLNVVCRSLTEENLKALERHIKVSEVRYSSFDGTAVISFDFPGHTTMIDARSCLENVFSAAFQNGEVTVDLMGYEFDDTYLTDNAEDYIDPHSFKGFAEAFDFGGGL